MSTAAKCGCGKRVAGVGSPFCKLCGEEYTTARKLDAARIETTGVCPDCQSPLASIEVPKFTDGDPTVCVFWRCRNLRCGFFAIGEEIPAVESTVIHESTKAYL